MRGKKSKPGQKSPRNPYLLPARKRKAGPMRDRRTKREKARLRQEEE